jgi:hypothetical protein
MRVTLIAKDDLVLIDNMTHKSDCSALLASNIAVVQWYDDNTGEVEYADATPNDPITDFSPYLPYVDAAERLGASLYNQGQPISTGG